MDGARGWRRDLRKHRLGSAISATKPRGIPQRKAEGPRPRPVPWKDHRLVVSQSAALSPCPAGTSECLTPLGFLKNEGGQGNKSSLPMSISGGRQAGENTKRGCQHLAGNLKWINGDGFVRSPSVALRGNFAIAARL